MRYAQVRTLLRAAEIGLQMSKRARLLGNVMTSSEPGFLLKGISELVRQALVANQ